MKRITVWFLFVFAVSCVGCGEGKTVTVGEGEGKGVYQRSIDKSRDVAAGASEKIKSGEKDVYGG